MEITWYGHSCFRLTERGMATVVCDPFDSETVGYEPLKIESGYCHLQSRCTRTQLI